MAGMTGRMLVAFMDALAALRNEISCQLHGRRLSGIAFVTTDDVLEVCAFWFRDGDLGDEPEAFLRMCPVEWHRSTSAPFDGVNALLGEMVSETDTKGDQRAKRMRFAFDACSRAVLESGFREWAADDVLITFSSVDPGAVLLSEERAFVKALNAPSVFDEWCRQMWVD